MARYAAIDVGTNSVLLLVAERRPDGSFAPVVERAEITRLGRGVDRSHRLDDAAIEETVRVLVAYADEARRLGATEIAVSATSAARDAENGAVFLAAARERAGLEVEIISGDVEAELCFSAVVSDLGRRISATGWVVLDIGGGSTEVIRGGDGIDFRKSFDVGSVRLTERLVHSDPVAPSEREAIRDHLRRTFSGLEHAPEGSRVVGVAGTVTTLYAIQNRIDPYDAGKVHGNVLRRAEAEALVTRLCELPLAERRRLPGLQPGRADVICAGAIILATALEALSAEECLVSDRGLRWGLLEHRFGSMR